MSYATHNQHKQNYIVYDTIRAQPNGCINLGCVGFGLYTSYCLVGQYDL